MTADPIHLPKAPFPEAAPGSGSGRVVPVAGLLGAVVASTCAAVGAFALGLTLASAPELGAAPAGPAPHGLLGADSDQDGLVDSLEVLRGTDPLSADTDGDGYLDVVELALGSRPDEFGSIPVSMSLNVGLVASAKGGLFRLTQLVYVPGNDVSQVDYRLYLKWQGQILEVSPDLYLAGATFNFVPSNFGADGVAVVTSFVPQDVMEFLGPVTFFATGAPIGVSNPTTAAGMTILPVAGALHEVLFAQGSQFSGLGTGTVYRPLQPPEELPGTYAQGQICYQTTSFVGISGPMQVFQVETSDCETADAYCSPACPIQVGTTFEVLDPVALIGG